MKEEHKVTDQNYCTSDLSVFIAKLRSLGLDSLRAKNMCVIGQRSDR